MSRFTMTAVLTIWFALFGVASSMLLAEKKALSVEVKELFFHGYNAYMNNAWPADELMPISCKGRVRGIDTSRGDIDDALGNFSLTLVDTLDTLAVLGETSEFLRAVQLVIETVTFDADLVVSVFETNIRELGGLLGAHAMMLDLKDNGDHNNHPFLSGYKNELLTMSLDLGDRLMKAFDTKTGIPYSMVNLRHGMDVNARKNQATCTACAGTILLEFGALSRFSGIPKYEQAARTAMEALWTRRTRQSMVGETINVTTGAWKRADAGIGAGIDSYYEYLLKAYIMLGDKIYLDVFEEQYDAIMALLSRGPFIFHANMHQPGVITRKHLDSLQMFWPGLQVLHGDVTKAIPMHKMHHTLSLKYDFPPEGYTTDLEVHWGNYPLRPEFIESTYFLYQATRDPFYLEVGKQSLENIKRFTKVECGFAAILDVREKTHEDKMDSFMLAETFKYLYLLFAEPEDLTLDVDQFVFTTEAHLLPVSLANVPMSFTPFKPLVQKSKPSLPKEVNDVIVFNHSVCLHDKYSELKRFLAITGAVPPTTPRFHVQWTSKAKTKNEFGNMESIKLKLDPEKLNIEDPAHMDYLTSIGISIEKASNGIRLVHNPAGLSQLAKREGMKFMQVLMKMSQQREEEKVIGSAVVAVMAPAVLGNVQIMAGPASFGFNLEMEFRIFEGNLVVSQPVHGCNKIINPAEVKGRIALVQRGNCMFITKVRKLQAAGALAVIVYDTNTRSQEAEKDPALFTMSGDGTNDVTIPAVFVWAKEGRRLQEYMTLHKDELLVQIYGSDWSID